MKKLIFILSLLCIILSGCQYQKKEKIAETHENPKTKELPDNAIGITYKNHIYFELEFDNIKGNYVFDTGADGLYYDSLFYNDSKFKHKRIILGKLPGVGVTKQLVKVVLDTIKFKLKDNNFTTTISPIIKLKPILGDFADGIIGGALFNKSILEISYDKEYVKIHSSIDSIDVTSYKKIKLEKVKNRFYLPLSVKINDSLLVKGKFALDLGSRNSIAFTNHTSKKYNFANKIGFKIPFYSEYAGIGGTSSSFYFKSNSLTIAGFELNNVVMKYSIDNSGALSKRKYLGLLGNPILEKFDLILDYINNYLYLKPNSKFNNPFKFSTIGFSFVDRNQTKGAWIVTGMYKGSNAEKAGLKIDDKIIEVNNIKISSINLKQQNTVWQQADSLELTIKKDDRISTKIKFALENHNNNLNGADL